MTSEQRAEAVAAPYGGCRGPLSKDIADAIREAVLEEREACAKAASGFHVTDFPADKRGALRQLRGDIADAISTRPAP